MMHQEYTNESDWVHLSKDPRLVERDIQTSDDKVMWYKTEQTLTEKVEKYRHDGRTSTWLPQDTVDYA